MNDIHKNQMTIKDLILAIIYWFNFLLNKWKLIFLIANIGAVLGLTYAYFQKTEYTATLTFALEDEKSNTGLTGALGLASQLGIDLGGSAGGAFSGANLMELIRSRNIVEKTLLTGVKTDSTIETLIEYYIRFNKLRELDWDKKTGLKNVMYPIKMERSLFSLKQDSILGKIYAKLVKNNLSVSQKDKKVSIIDVNMSSENELFSKLFTETLVQVVSDFYIDTKSKKAAINVSILQKQADSVRAKLNEVINDVARASDNTFNLNPVYSIERSTAIQKQVDIQANTAILSELVKNLEVAKVSLRKETPLIQIIDKPILPLTKIKPSKLKFGLLFGVLFGFLSVISLILKKMYGNIMD